MFGLNKTELGYAYTLNAESLHMDIYQVVNLSETFATMDYTLSFAALIDTSIFICFSFCYIQLG